MAIPIAPTPVLYGKNARTFLKKVEANKDKKTGPVPTPKATAILDKILADAGVKK
jgi:hypothetical protein